MDFQYIREQINVTWSKKWLVKRNTSFEEILGRTLMPAEYSRYFEHHPKAQKLFKPEYAQFLTATTASSIESVRVYTEALHPKIGMAVSVGNRSDDEAEQYAEEVLAQWRRKKSPLISHSLFPAEQPSRPNEQFTYAPPQSSNGCCNLL